MRHATLFIALSLLLIGMSPAYAGDTKKPATTDKATHTAPAVAPGHPGAVGARPYGARPAPGRPGLARPDARFAGRPGDLHRDDRRDMHGRPGDRRYDHYHFAHRDFHHFSPHEHALWVGGGWHQEWHNGRFGWWWFVDGVQYWYAQPVYPYPMAVSEVVYNEPEPVAEGMPGAVMVERPAAVVAPAPTYRYYCPSVGYYPDVQNCPTQFQRVPAN